MPTDEIYLASVSTDEEVLSCDKDLYSKFASLKPTARNVMQFASLYGFLGLEHGYQAGKGTCQLQRLLGGGMGPDADVPRTSNLWRIGSTSTTT